MAGVLLAVTSILATSAAVGQQVSGSGAQVVEEIVVTAQKRTQNIQDIGISITSLGESQLAELGVTSTLDIVHQVPSMQFSSFSPAFAVINLRGVSQNDFVDHYEPPVAVFSDEAYVSAPTAFDLQMFDMQRVEVLRGPQGTLFGRNATGGIVHYISRKPTAEFEGYSTLTVGEYEQIKFEGALSGPLSERLLGRFSFATNHHDGWVENDIGPDLNSAKNYAYRAQLLFSVTENLEVLAKLHGTEDDARTGGFQHRSAFLNSEGMAETVPADVDMYGTCAGCDPRGYRNTAPWNVQHDFIGRWERSLIGGTGRITWDLGGFELTSVSDYLEIEKEYRTDSDGSPIDFAIFIADQPSFEQLSQEIRIASDWERGHWVAGLYYLDIDGDYLSGIDLDLFGVRSLTTAAYTLTTESWAVFGQLDYELSPHWSVIAGARYTEDRKEMDYLRTGTGLLAGEDPFTGKQNFENVSAKLQLEWKPHDELLLYGGVNRGHKGGSFAAPFFPPVIAEILPHDEEVLTSYETGIKTSLLNRTTRLNAAAFYYDYSDYQAFSFTNLISAVENLDARVTGLEIELQSQLFGGLDLGLGISILDGKIKNATLPNGRVDDRKMPMAPDYSINGLVRYSWPAFTGGLAAQIDFQYSDDYYFHVMNESVVRGGDYLIGNGRLSYTTNDERWELAVFVKNIGDKAYITNAQHAAALGFALDTYAPPRWMGASVAYSWK